VNRAQLSSHELPRRGALPVCPRSATITFVTVTVTVRPNGARTEVRGLPWTGNPRDGYAALEDAIDASRRGQVLYDRQHKAFTVSRSHTELLIYRLAQKFGHVHVIQYGGITKCVEECWRLRDLDTSATCQCSCAGANHGTGVAPGRIVGQVNAGALAVASTGPREYDIYGTL